MKISALFILVAILFEKSSACVGIGDSCSKVGTECCSSSDASKNTQCLGDDNVAILRNYSCTECVTAEPWTCYDEISMPEWYGTLFITSLIMMMSLVLFFGMIMEFLKCVGVIPNPKRDRPSGHEGHDWHDDDDNLLVIVLPEEI